MVAAPCPSAATTLEVVMQGHEARQRRREKEGLREQRSSFRAVEVKGSVHRENIEQRMRRDRKYKERIAQLIGNVSILILVERRTVTELITRE